ncbi:hypothetical protein CMUS01_14040 [Colletotrichum musicola]|uniref:Uncharacterized protein n=1 Tax=Colletotrichum musicola TaxID=2175873 RepID=A0A8H6J755_9PEZI|nr:hypothetical protein CMUS01_14040 [Colletotrichum musicola]
MLPDATLVLFKPSAARTSAIQQPDEADCPIKGNSNNIRSLIQVRRVPPAFGVAVQLIVDGCKPSKPPMVDTIIDVEADARTAGSSIPFLPLGNVLETLRRHCKSTNTAPTVRANMKCQAVAGGVQQSPQNVGLAATGEMAGTCNLKWGPVLGRWQPSHVAIQHDVRWTAAEPQSPFVGGRLVEHKPRSGCPANEAQKKPMRQRRILPSDMAQVEAATHPPSASPNPGAIDDQPNSRRRDSASAVERGANVAGRSGQSWHRMDGDAGQRRQSTLVDPIRRSGPSQPRAVSTFCGGSLPSDRPVGAPERTRMKKSGHRLSLFHSIQRSLWLSPKIPGSVALSSL